MNKLLDSDARLAALTQFDKSFLVEAGAGSGKTSLLAGRVVGLLAAGVKPVNIASVSFTEMAASELMGRIHDFATSMAEGFVPRDLSDAWPEGPTEAQIANLKLALEELSDLTCTTIHGFCRKLLRPYPVEAGIDPGAVVMEPDEATLIFEDVLDRWLRRKLSGSDHMANIVTYSVGVDTDKTVAAVTSIAHMMRSSPTLRVHAGETEPDTKPFFAAVAAFETMASNCPDDHATFVSAWKTTAEKVRSAVARPVHAACVDISLLEADAPLALKSGGLKKYKLKTAWNAISKGTGDALNAEGERLHVACSEAFEALKEASAAHALSLLVEEIRPVTEEFAAYKTSAALLDFDDLLLTALKMLKNHPEVLKALKNVYTHVLVDEYQDTDPVQTEIFCLLCFEKDSQKGMIPRPGGIFFVGDPKQSIYRFRGADVETYVEMRELMRAHSADSVREIFMNFRSNQGIIEFVNTVFEGPMKEAGQPGFAALASSRGPGSGPAVLKYEAPDPADAKIDIRRKKVADTVADAIRHLLKTGTVEDKEEGQRPVRHSDIALLAPVNTNLFWLEGALEEKGIPVSTQAGKGLFQQQEVKDLIALTRVLGDHKDTLALGALLRGSFFGFTDRELLDAATTVPADEKRGLGFVNLDTPFAQIGHSAIAQVVVTLRRLREEASATTPFDKLSDAIDVFDIRSKTRNRDDSNAARRLANIERYLEMSKSFDVRGMRAFSDFMRARWEDAEKVQEGRPGSGGNAVSIVTIHSSKGLEWPIVFMVNCETEFNNRQSHFTDVKNSTFSMRFMKQKPTDFDAFSATRKWEEHAERVRLMYVGLTRARDLLVVPDLQSATTAPKSWADLVDLGLEEIETMNIPPSGTVFKPLMDNGPTPTLEQYDEAMRSVAAKKHVIKKETPSDHEWHADREGSLGIDDLADAVPIIDAYANVKGGAERGNILHKLMEEVVNGETGTDPSVLERRAGELIAQVTAAAIGPTPELYAAEIARCVISTLNLPVVAAMLPYLVAEVGVSGMETSDAVETLTIGVCDAMEFVSGRIRTVIDWKSDLRPAQATVDAHVKQVRKYMRITEAERGLIVYMSSGRVVEVGP